MVVVRKQSRRLKHRRRIFAAVTIALGLLLALILTEVGLRIYVAGRGWTPNCYVTGLAFFVPHAEAGHTLRPNLRLRSSAYDVSTNSFGLRGEQITRAKPANTIRVMVLGGSSVFGYLVPDGQDSCIELQKELSTRQSFSEKRIEVLNAGVPGYNMTQCRLRFTNDLAELKPDWVILYLGWNDSPTIISQAPESIDRTPPGPSWWQRLMIQSVGYGLLNHRLLPADAPQFAPPEVPSTEVTQAGDIQFRNDYQALVDAVHESGANVLVSTQLMAGNERCVNLDQFLGSSAKQIQTNRKIAQAITQAVRDLARTNDLPLVDIAKNTPCDESLLGDAVHLTRKGHQIIAQQWANAFPHTNESAASPQ